MTQSKTAMASSTSTSRVDASSIDIGGNGMRNAQTPLPLLPVLRMLIVGLIGLGYVSTLPFGPQSTEVLHFLGYDPSWYGVSMLFFLSGFLAHRSLDRHNSIAKFIGSRALRILPILLIFCLLVIGVLYPLFGAPQTELSGVEVLMQRGRYVLSVVSCIDGNAPTPGLLNGSKYPNLIQGSLWTFRWGLVAYILTCLLWWSGLFKHKLAIFVLAMLVMLSYGLFASLQFYIADPSPAKKFVATGFRLGWIYLLGMSVYGYRRSLPPLLLGRKLLFWAVFFICLAAVLYHLYPWTTAIEIAVTLAFACLCSLTILADHQGAKGQKKKWLSRIPDLSLGLYVFIWPVTQIVLLHVPSLSLGLLFSASLLISILISWALYVAVQKPVQRRIHRA